MKYIVIFAMVFMLCGYGNRRNEKNLDIAAGQYVGNYLFSTDQGDCIEISGEDLLNHKEGLAGNHSIFQRSWCEQYPFINQRNQYSCTIYVL